MTERSDGPAGEGVHVVVPERPGPLIHLKGASGRDRDELDELVNEFRRDVDKPVGWFDVTIFSGGLGY